MTQLVLIKLEWLNLSSNRNTLVHKLNRCLLLRLLLRHIVAELEADVIPIVLQLSKSEMSDDFRSEAAGVSMHVIVSVVAVDLYGASCSASNALIVSLCREKVSFCRIHCQTICRHPLDNFFDAGGDATGTCDSVIATTSKVQCL